MQLKKSFQNLSKSNSSCANRKSFQNQICNHGKVVSKSESQELVLQIESRFKTVKF